MLKRLPLLLPVLAALAACNVPTETPLVVQRWVLPVEDTELGVEQLVPPTVTLQDGSFLIGLDPASVSASLGELCSACTPFDGTVVSSMPPFTAQIETTASLPTDVEGGEVADGSMQLSVQNGLSFDPIEGGGTLTLSVSDASGGAELAEVVLDGNDVSLASGTTVARTVDVGSGTVGSTLAVEAEVVSVGGQSATVDLDREITVTLSSAELLLGSVTVQVGTKDVAFDPVEIDVQDFSESLTDGILEGSVLLDVSNPFAVTVDGTLDIGDVSKPLTIGPDGTSRLTLDYTGDELRSFLGGSGVILSAEGTATGGVITVTPDEVLPVEARLDVLVEVGGEGGAR